MGSFNDQLHFSPGFVVPIQFAARQNQRFRLLSSSIHPTRYHISSSFGGETKRRFIVDYRRSEHGFQRGKFYVSRICSTEVVYFRRIQLFLTEKLALKNVLF
jgi:hypothetical protein